MRPLACSVIAVSALAVGTAAGALHAGSGTPMQAVTQTAGDRHDRQVLRVDNHHLRWQHNAQTLVLTSAAAGLLVTDASNTLPLQLRKGDHLRSANGQSIASVADLLRALRAAAGTPVTVEVVRAQAPLTLHWAASLYAPLLPPAPPPPPRHHDPHGSPSWSHARRSTDSLGVHASRRMLCPAAPADMPPMACGNAGWRRMLRSLTRTTSSKRPRCRRS